METAAKVGLALPAIAEKDFWVCWTLRHIFSLPRPYSNVIFKGGTTLSKVYGLIERFSEDIDLAVDREDLGFTGDRDPANVVEKNRRKKLVKKLVKDGAAFVQEDFRPKLEAEIADVLGTPGGNWRIEPSADRDGSLDFHYPTAFPEPANTPRYARRFIFLEMGARAEHWPNLETDIRPYAAQHFPDQFKDGGSCRVKVLEASRTFWEKAFVLFRETCTEADPDKAHRLSRHYYDLVMMGRDQVAERALADEELINAVRKFDMDFFYRDGVDYDHARRGSFRLVPDQDKRRLLRQDYNAMVAEMFYGSPPDFEGTYCGRSKICIWRAEGNGENEGKATPE
jgi:hypothetical protein